MRDKFGLSAIPILLLLTLIYAIFAKACGIENP